MKAKIRDIEIDAHELKPGAKYLVVVNGNLVTQQDILHLRTALLEMTSDCIVMMSYGAPEDTVKVFGIGLEEEGKVNLVDSYYDKAAKAEGKYRDDSAGLNKKGRK